MVQFLFLWFLLLKFKFTVVLIVSSDILLVQSDRLPLNLKTIILTCTFVKDKFRHSDIKWTGSGVMWGTVITDEYVLEIGTLKSIYFIDLILDYLY